MTRWSEAELTEFFGALATFHDGPHSYEFTTSRDGLRLLFTLFEFEGEVCVSLYRDGLPEPLFTVVRRFCTHAQVLRDGSGRSCLEVGSPAHAVADPGFALIFSYGVRILVEPQFSVQLIEPRYPAV